VSSTLSGVESDGGPQELQTTYAADGAGRVAAMTPPDGTAAIVRYTYDAEGRVSQIEQGEQVEGWEYDATGNLVRTRVGVAPGVTVEARSYDGLDRLARIVDATGPVTSSSTRTPAPSARWISGRVRPARPAAAALAPRALRRARSTDGVDRGRRTARDDAGVVQRARLDRDEPPRRRPDEEFDISGSPPSTTVPGLATTEAWPDPDGRVERTLETEGAASFDTRYAYWPTGELRRVETGPLQRGRVELGYRYDGRPTSTEISPDGLGLTSTAQYSVLGEALGRTTPLQVGTDLHLDRMRRPAREGRRSATGHTYTYDPSGRLVTRTDPLDAVEQYSQFDLRGNPWHVVTPAGAIDATFDLRDRLRSRVVSGGTTGPRSPRPSTTTVSTD
jgi:YD repeat-containing protein